MTFDSVTYALFLPVVFLLYWALPSTRLQNILLLAASYVFYAAWSWRFLALFFVTSLISWFAAAQIGRNRHRRAWLGVALVTGFGTLAVFKYLGWGLASFAELLELFGMSASLPTLALVLPVGISFHTFQTVGYVIDVYRRDLEPTPDPIAFLVFGSFFPQLVAGPIERARDLLPQFVAPRRFDPARATDGVLQMLYGLIMKVVVADQLAQITHPVFADPAAHGPWSILVAVWAFAFQIYGDFAGYSHMAIGAGRLFGISLTRNFAYPYFSTSPAEFWHRWHISLSSWFRDYVYVSLGGNRVSPLRRRINVFVTFVLSGVWHGAAWTFVVWGAYWGLLVAIEGRGPRTDLRTPMGKRPLPSLKQILLGVLMFHVACVGWIFFRADSVRAGISILTRLVELPGSTIPEGIFAPTLTVVAPLVVWEWWTAPGRTG
jgi:alginate O-acetyltransferase complex protein AlgI